MGDGFHVVVSLGVDLAVNLEAIGLNDLAIDAIVVFCLS
jgi:hypothetical protein